MALAGNQHGVKLKDPNVRQQAYQQYCHHLSLGNGKKSWYFNHPEFRCTWETMEKYIKDHNEFDPFTKKIAEAKGYGVWEGLVQDAAKGINKDVNTAALQMYMRNKYKWDRADQVHDDDDGTALQANEKLMGQLSQLQNKD
jgi:hypothetical protein